MLIMPRHEHKSGCRGVPYHGMGVMIVRNLSSAGWGSALPVFIESWPTR